MRSSYVLLAFGVVATMWFSECVEAKTSSSVTGHVKLDPSEQTAGGAVTIVLYSKSGKRIETAQVESSGNFTLYTISSQPDGVYLLDLCGTTVDEYDSLLVRVQNGQVSGVISRKSPLQLPPQIHSEAWGSSNMELVFTPLFKTNYERKSAPWRLRDIWDYKIRILQLLALAFVVWFPQVIRDLPQDMREDLLGEKEADLGDTNALIKTLTGRPQSEETNAVKQK